MRQRLIKPLIWVAAIIGLILLLFVFFFRTSSGSNTAQPALIESVINIAGDDVVLCLDPRLDSVESGLVDFSVVPTADVEGFGTLIDSQVRYFGPELPPTQYVMSHDLAGRRCGPFRPKNAEIYKMGAGKHPEYATYRAYIVDAKVVRIEGFYNNRENEAGYQKYQADKEG